MITGLLALAAAVAAYRQLRQQNKLLGKQIEDDRNHRTDEKRVKSAVARASLPDALSSIGEYAVHCLDFLQPTQPFSSPRSYANPPSFPVDATDTLKASLQLLDGRAADSVVSVILFAQVQRARLKRYTAWHELEVAQRMYDAIWLRFLTDRIYEFARGEVEEISPPPKKARLKELDSTFTIMHSDMVEDVSGEVQDHLQALFNLRACDGVTPTTSE